MRRGRQWQSAATAWPTFCLLLYFPDPDHVIGPEGGHSARHRLHSGEPHLQAGQRCAHARLLRGWERLSAQVGATHCRPTHLLTCREALVDLKKCEALCISLHLCHWNGQAPHEKQIMSRLKLFFFFPLATVSCFLNRLNGKTACLPDMMSVSRIFFLKSN